MKTRVRMIAVCAILVAIIAVLQTLAALFPLKVAGISVSLVTIPIAVAGMFCGYAGSIVVGASFGLVVMIHCITGLDPTGAMLFQLNPFFTVILTLLRGVFVGFAVAFIYRLTRSIKKQYIRYLITAALAPVMNTGFFVLTFYALFNSVLLDFAGAAGQSVFEFIIVGFVGLNFLFEFVTTVLLAPPVCKAVQKNDQE